jgi:hypothetical protein
MASSVDANGNLSASGVMDNVAAQLKVLNSDVKTVDASVWKYGIGIGVLAGAFIGVRQESQKKDIPIISHYARVKNVHI